jgi:putative RecB family exonuclease
VKLPRPLSHSSISLYQECPLKYKFKYVDKIPEKPRHFFSFGQSVHLALEYFYGVKTPTPPSLEDLLKSYREQWVKGGYRDEAQEAEYFEEGRRILTRFHDKHAKDFKLPYFVEYAFTFEVEGVPVTGRIDRVDKLEDGRLSVLDYKTGKQLATGRIDTDAQLTMYQLACEKGLGAEVGELVFYHLPTLKQHRSARRPSPLVDELKSRVVSTAEAITKEKFDPKPSEGVCKWCDFKPICPIYKDQFAGAPSAKAAGEPEIAALVDRYGRGRRGGGRGPGPVRGDGQARLRAGVRGVLRGLGRAGREVGVRRQEEGPRPHQEGRRLRQGPRPVGPPRQQAHGGPRDRR